ncbi:hypothetical protein GF413_04590 [Candidatus Micrarchaeota archaeon]|nr:hypothetical protein [Candidatus Micrarchaeota archaeon]
MGSIDYYRLLKEGPSTINDTDWEEVLSATVYQKETEHNLDAASSAFQNLIFSGASEWVAKKKRIVKVAQRSHSNPRRLSEYCLHSIRNVCAQETKQGDAYEDNPEIALIHRQVSDHLRKLHAENTLCSQRLRSRTGKDLCNMWGLMEWGENWLQRSPAISTEDLLRELPFIEASHSGKGIFDYGATLPGYLPSILMLYSAALSTAQMCSNVVKKITPPLSKTGAFSGEYESALDKPETDAPWCVRIPGPEQLLRYKNLRDRFIESLTEREERVFELKEEGFPIGGDSVQAPMLSEHRKQ